MRLTAISDRGVASMAVEVGDRVTVLAPLAEFYADVAGWRAEADQIVEGDRHLADVVRAVPVPTTSKVLCVAINYDMHASETSSAVSELPNFFGRFWATLVTDGTPVPVPDSEPGLDWEVELAVVVGATLTAVSADELRSGARPGAVLGYTVFNDVSARRHQYATSQFGLGKNSDQSGPVGSTIVTADAIDVDDLRLTTVVNDQLMQDGTTADMVHKIPELLAYASETVTLRPGDLIATGTPAGVGFRREPPVLLHPGDVVTVEIEGIGSVRSPMVPSSYRR